MNVTPQKLHKGDLVHIAANLGASMSHFQSDTDAIVLGSYADLYPQYDTKGTQTDHYSLFIKGGGESAWYYDSQLTLIESSRLDLLDEWKRQRTERVREAKDLDWIFSHSTDVLVKPSGATLVGLAECLGFTEDQLWGSRGEGMTFYSNGLAVLAHAAPFLTANDKAGWLAYCETFKQEHNR